MAAPLGAFVLRDCLVSIAATDYANQCTTARLTPEQETQTLRTLVPDGIVQDVDTAAWTLELAGIQDFTAAQGMARYLFDNDGQQVDLILEPRKSLVSWAVSIKVKMPEIGGEQGNWATVELELPCIGAPVPTDPI